MPEFVFPGDVPQVKAETPYTKLTSDFVSVGEYRGNPILEVDREGIACSSPKRSGTSRTCCAPVTWHSWPRSSTIPRPPATTASSRSSCSRTRTSPPPACLPGCQDTGTAIVMGKKGQHVWTTATTPRRRRGGDRPRRVRDLHADEPALLADGAAGHVRGGQHRQQPAGPDRDLRRPTATSTSSCSWPRAAARPTRAYLFQETKALLNPDSLLEFLDEKIRTLGTAACPPYHLAIVIGGTVGRAHAEDRQARVGAATSTRCRRRATTLGRGFRDRRARGRRCSSSRSSTGIGAQFGGKYFCHDVRVIRLPRHGASCPVGDRRLLLRRPPGARQDHRATASSSSSSRPTRRKYLPDVTDDDLGGDVVRDRPDAADGRDPRRALAATRSRRACRSRARWSSPATSPTPSSRSASIAARACPSTSRTTCVYYAGPAKTPAGYASGSFGPTTAGRMDATSTSSRRQAAAS